MAFEYRRMNERDQILYGSWNNNKPYFGNWLVDEERNIYLINFGGRGEHPDVQNYEPDSLLLRYKETNVFFEGRYKSETVVPKEQWETNWIVDMQLPINLKSEIDTIIKLIEEALTCQEDTWDRLFAGKTKIHVIVENIKLVD
jgi:hypothetical protein